MCTITEAAPPGRGALPAGLDFAWHAEAVHVWLLWPDGRVRGCSPAARRALEGGEAPEGRPLGALLSGGGPALLGEAMKGAGAGPVRGLPLTFGDGERYSFAARCTLYPAQGGWVVVGEAPSAAQRRLQDEMMELTAELARVARDRAQVAARLEAALAELRTSHWHVRRIQEFLPICAECHRVPEAAPGSDGWKPLVSFLAENGLMMTHGYCPECEGRVIEGLDAS